MRAAASFVGARSVRPTAPGASAATALVASGADCLVVSLETTTPTVLTAATAAGLGVMVHTAPNDFDVAGVRAQLARLNIPRGSTVWLAVGGASICAPAMDPLVLQSKINAWARAVIEVGHIGGLRIDGPQPLTGAELYALAVTRYARGAERVVDRNGNDAEPTCGWCMVGLRPSRDWVGLTSEVAFVQEDRRRRLPTWLVDGPPVGDAWLLGLDASRWQGRLKGDALEGCNITTPTGRAIGSIGFAYFKATHGVGGVDPEFAANAASSAAMKRRGFYMWLVPTQDPIAQADHFVRTIRPYDRAHDLPPAIDFEDDGGGRVRDGALLDVARRCVERVEAQLGVRRAVVYTGRWFWIQACGDRDDAFFADRPLWHAQYPGHVPDVDEEPAIARPWATRGITETFWQFDGDRGLVLPREATATGQPVDADFNRFRGDGPALDAFIASARRGPQSHGTTAT